MSTGRLPASFFREPVAQLEAWANDADISEKHEANAPVGTWNTTRSWRYTLHQSACKAELAHLCSKGYTSWQAIPGCALWEICEKSEIRKLAGDMVDPGFTLIPLSLYFNDKNLLKVDLALCRGKSQRDKRKDIKEREDKRMLARASKGVY